MAHAQGGLRKTHYWLTIRIQVTRTLAECVGKQILWYWCPESIKTPCATVECLVHTVTRHYISSETLCVELSTVCLGHATAMWDSSITYWEMALFLDLKQREIWIWECKYLPIVKTLEMINTLIKLQPYHTSALNLAISNINDTYVVISYATWPYFTVMVFNKTMQRNILNLLCLAKIPCHLYGIYC